MSTMNTISISTFEVVTQRVMDSKQMNETITTQSPGKSPMVPEFPMFMAMTYFRFGGCGILSICGLITNTINMIVFFRQGVLTESSTVSLFGLSLADFLLEFFMFMMSIFYAMGIYLDPYSVNFDPWGFYTISIRQKNVYGAIGCWITAYLAFERCISVLFPFKVKLIYSPKRSLFAISSIFVGTLLTFIPLLSQYIFVLEKRNNESYISYMRNPRWSMEIDKIFHFVNPIGLRSIAIAIVVLGNITILVAVKASKEWRKSVSTASKTTTSHGQQGGAERNEKQQNKDAFHKERKLIRMISIICVIFMICYAPDVGIIILFKATTVIDESAKNVWFSVIYVLECFNASINIVIYYFMSSNYKKEFDALFRIKSKK